MGGISKNFVAQILFLNWLEWFQEIGDYVEISCLDF